MLDLQEVIRASSVDLELHDLLKKPPSELLGVSAAASDALAKVGIKTVFDLGTSNLFASARAVLEMTRSGTASARFGISSGDLLKDNAQFSSLGEVAKLNIDKLRLLSPQRARELRMSLDVSTIRDLAFWPPHLAARRLVGEEAGMTADPEYLQTEELRPRMGQFPTERVYYTTLVMLQMLGNDVPEQHPLNGPVSLDPAVQAEELTRPAVGALLTFSQSWYSQGVTLGHMLHSLALSPGEATRIAVIDWSRRTRATASEAISEAEQLDSATQHARALSEVQQAVASDFQAGGSQSSSSSSSKSGSAAVAGGSGFLTSLFVSGDVSSTSQSASTNAQAASSSWSIGNRSVMSAMTQDVNDRTEQHSSSVRNRRATAVREVSQSEHEEVSTRVVANYNHMHALTVQYYEVVQIYRAEAQLHRADRCLFVPMKLLDFSDANGMKTVERFRAALIGAALNRRIRSLLIDDTTAVAIKPVVPIKFSARLPDLSHVSEPLLERLTVRPQMIMRATSSILSAEAPASTSEPEVTTPSVIGLRLWDDNIIAMASRIIDRPLIRTDSDALHVPDDTEILSISFDNINVRNVRIDQAGGINQTFTVPSDIARIDLPRGVPMIELNSIHVGKTDDAPKSGSMTLSCAYLGRRFNLPAIPLELSHGTALQQVLAFQNDQANRRNELLKHLQDAREYYSQAVFRSLDSTALTQILSHVEWNGKPLIDQVEPRPVSVAGNYLILRAPVEDKENVGIGGVENQAVTWPELLKQRGLEIGKHSDQRMIPIPTGGVFAEAVLGRSNSAEKLDITRFWNWEDSPIPLSPPEIAAVRTGSREAPEDLEPGQLSQPVLNIVNPTNLPAPDSIGTVLGALSSLNFRDMSGLAGTQGLVKAGMEGTLQAATEAGQLASENMEIAAQKSVAMGQIAGEIAKSAIAAFTGNPAAAAGGGKVQGISGDGARINHGRSMDSRGLPGPGGSTSSTGSGTPSGTRSSDSVMPFANGSGGSSGSGTFPDDSGDSIPTRSVSREGAYADQGAFGYSPDAVSATTAPYDSSSGLQATPVVFGRDDVDAAQKYAPIWSDLLRFEVPSEVVTALTARNMKVQRFDDAIGDLNLDLYSVKVTKLPKINGAAVDAAGLLKHIRLNFNEFIDTSNSEFFPYKVGEDDTKWASAGPVGSVFKINIKGPDNAAVVGSLVEDSRWRFSTVHAPDTGGHPVSGHREWGFRNVDDGSLVFYIRGADRSTEAPETLFDFLTFSGADDLWLSFQDKLVKFVNTNGGTAMRGDRFSKRFKWTVVRILLGLSNKSGIQV